MLIGDKVDVDAALIVGMITSSASVELGVAATVTTLPATLETVVVPREAQTNCCKQSPVRWRKIGWMLLHLGHQQCLGHSL